MSKSKKHLLWEKSLANYNKAQFLQKSKLVEKKKVEISSGPFEVEYWYDEDARDAGLGEVLSDKFTNLNDAKTVVYNLVNGEGYASAEVIDKNGNVVFGYDGENSWSDTEESVPLSNEPLGEALNKMSAEELMHRLYDENAYVYEAFDENDELFIIFDSWKDVNIAIKILDPNAEKDDTTELDNYNWGFVDEWAPCDICRKAVRTSPDSYSWTSDFWIDKSNGNLVCGDCIREDTDLAQAYLESLVNNPKNANTILSEDDLGNFGFIEIEDDFEHGFYGRADSPKEILDKALTEHPNGIFIFSLTGVGQFASYFSLWAEEDSLEQEDYDEDEEYELNESTTEDLKVERYKGNEWAIYSYRANAWIYFGTEKEMKDLYAKMKEHEVPLSKKEVEYKLLYGEGLTESNESNAIKLEPKHDRSKSFYGKAFVAINPSGEFKTLLSYGQPVVRIYTDDNRVELLPLWNASQTTLRHVKEFLKQNGFTATSTGQIAKDYKLFERVSTRRNRKVREAKQTDETGEFLIYYWKTKEDIKEGFSDIFVDTYTSKNTAINEAKKLVDVEKQALVEVVNEKNESVFRYSGKRARV